MLKNEEVDSWNALFPECQINKSNLTHPTEHFFTNALVSYLRCLGYNVEPPFSLHAENKENNKEYRLFSMKLVRKTDQILKITDKSFAFKYYDLIRPTPKKLTHILRILLNYYYYYNTYREKVFEMASQRISELEDLKAMNDDTRRENERRKEEDANTKSAIDSLMEELPMARKKLKELDAKRTLQEENMQKINHTYEELKDKLKHLEEQKDNFRRRVVPDEESQELQKQLELLRSELAEHKQMEQRMEEKLRESKENSDKLQHLSKDIEKAREIIPLRLLEQSLETNKQFEKAQKELNEVESKHNNMLQQIKEASLEFESSEQQHQSKKREFEIKQIELQKQYEAKHLELQQKNSQIFELDEEHHVLECELEEQKDVAEYLKQNIKVVMEHYEN